MIVLTDWPKTKHIYAHLRGVETEKLLELRKQLFHLMMMSRTEMAGGYAITYCADEIEEELKFRKVKLEEL